MTEAEFQIVKSTGFVLAFALAVAIQRWSRPLIARRRPLESHEVALPGMQGRQAAAPGAAPRG